MVSRRDFVRLAAATPALTLPSIGFAQDEPYPSRIITSVCMFAPGTGADIFVRFYAKKLQELANQTVNVENKVGMAGNIATEYVARSKPDGYTIFIAPASSILVAGQFLYKKLNYDPINDFTSVTSLAKLPFVLVVAPDIGVNSVADLVKYLKTKPDNGFFASSTTSGLIASELVKTQFGLKTTEVKYKSGLDALNDLLAHNIDFQFTDPVTVKERIATGKLKALMLTSAEPFAALPNIPSAKQAGVNNLDLISWWSVHVPAKTPRPVVDTLTTWFNQIARSDDAKAFLTNLGSDPLIGDAALVDKMIKAETEEWKEYVKIAKIEPQ
ncbi:MAG TPA: tripartite tricarboxylate transporter substrate binding protein [Xanthobacteraceae bacterium]|nr:tripartite tricarboxylate transporter substrate binding protein [Xanthobacteraceae bacterium]